MVVDARCAATSARLDLFSPYLSTGRITLLLVIPFLLTLLIP